MDIKFNIGKRVFYFGIYRIMKNHNPKQIRFIVGTDKVVDSKLNRKGFYWYKLQNRNYYEFL